LSIVRVLLRVISYQPAIMINGSHSAPTGAGLLYSSPSQGCKSKGNNDRCGTDLGADRFAAGERTDRTSSVDSMSFPDTTYHISRVTTSQLYSIPTSHTLRALLFLFCFVCFEYHTFGLYGIPYSE